MPNVDSVLTLQIHYRQEKQLQSVFRTEKLKITISDGLSAAPNHSLFVILILMMKVNKNSLSLKKKIKKQNCIANLTTC